jgi:pyruvate ferredoxin oxidoreductase beta subunit
MKVKGREDVRVVGQGGDGGTGDIGFACLSGMFERDDDVLFVCCENEACLNTGAPPPAARTATTLAVGAESGKGKKAALDAMAHEIPYVATATVGDLRDLADGVPGFSCARRLRKPPASAFHAGSSVPLSLAVR